MIRFVSFSTGTKPADQLDRAITANGLGEFYDQQLELEQNYRFMLKYTAEGIKDPERQKIYQHIFRIRTGRQLCRYFENEVF